METLYRHTQTGVVLPGVIVLALSVGAWLLLPRSGSAGVALIVVGVLVLLLFSTLTTTVRSDRVELAFGVGLIGRRIDVRRIADVSVVRNRWWYGWGIRLTPHGWMWNVSGLRAVELAYTNGKRFRIGSDEPEALAAAIQRAMRPAA